MARGINENVRYRGRTFHIQTEERGRGHPVVVSSLFYRGMILSELRVASDRGGTGPADLRAEVHGRMVEGLKKGLYDEKIEACLSFLEGGLTRGASADEDALLRLLREQLLPSLSRELGVELSCDDLLSIREGMARTEGRTMKERFLSLCAELYLRVKDRCDREGFRALVRRWSLSLPLPEREKGR